MEIYKFKIGDKCRVKKNYKGETFGISREILSEYEGKEFTISDRIYNKEKDFITYKFKEEDPLYGFLWYQDMLEKIRKEEK